MKNEKNNEIISFNFENSKIRTLLLEEKLYFIAKDLANILGYTNPQKAIRDHCKKAFALGVNESFTLDPQTIIIPESDIFRLIISSKLPSAEKFENWVMEEVLPSIRKTGSYSTTPQPQPTPTYTPKELVEIFLELCPFFKNRKIYKLKHFYKKYCDWLDYNKVDRKFFGDRTFKTALFRNGFHFIELEKDVGCFYTDIADYNYINSEYDIALYYKHHIKTQEYRENAGLIVNDSLSLITSRETINEVIDTMVEEKTIALINEYNNKSPLIKSNDKNDNIDDYKHNKEDKSYYIEYNYNNVPYYYNIVNQFVTEMLIYDVSSAITCFDVYNVFRKWCIDKSINPITHNKFGRGLYSFGINKTYVSGDLKGYGGIKFNDRVEA